MFHHLRHHARFYGAILLGGLAGASVPLLPAGFGAMRGIFGGDVFFLAYLLSMGLLVRDSTAQQLRQHVRKIDETAPYIFLLTALGAGFSLATIFTLLHNRGLPMALRIGVSILTVVLAWFALHVAAAFHYAHRFYTRARNAPQTTTETEKDDAGGLIFPETAAPALWDFLYFSFVIGMTAQVSDVQVTGASMRRFVLLHGIAAFFFNAIILALAVNVAAGLSSS